MSEERGSEHNEEPEAADEAGRKPDLEFEPSGFVVTHEHKRFEEICEDARRYRYVVLYTGEAGAGKTYSGTHYSSWDLVESLSSQYAYILDPPKEVFTRRTAYFSAVPASSPKTVSNMVENSRNLLSWLVDVAIERDGWEGTTSLESSAADRTELLIVDEAQFLQNQALERLRYEYDRGNFGLILMSMPGFENVLARYKQFHSRVGDVYKVKPLDPDSVGQILRRPDLLGTNLTSKALPTEIVPAVFNATQGNFRKIKMLVQRVELILEMNQAEVATTATVMGASSQLLPGLD